MKKDKPDYYTARSKCRERRTVAPAVTPAAEETYTDAVEECLKMKFPN